METAIGILGILLIVLMVVCRVFVMAVASKGGTKPPGIGLFSSQKEERVWTGTK